MKRVHRVASLALCLSMWGCSGGTNPAVELVPGKFVNDEPLQLAGAGEEKKSSRCVIDAINGKPLSKSATWTVKRGDEAVIAGWAYHKDGSGASNPLFIRITGAVQTYYAMTTERPAHPSVNEEFKLDPSIDTGFTLRAATAGLEPDRYIISILQRTPTRLEACDVPATLIVN